MVGGTLQCRWCSANFLSLIFTVVGQNRKKNGFFVNLISQDLQVARISNFTCREIVVGGQCTFFVQFCIFQKNMQNSICKFSSAASLQPGNCAEDPSDMM